MSRTRIYYRALLTQEHVDSWNAKVYKSFHPYTPGDWIDLWYKQGSRNKDQYSLTVGDAIFSADALNAFHELAGKYEAGQRWDPRDEMRVSELAGLCAFETAAAAYEYGSDGPYDSLYVTFDGIYLCPAPEDGGVVAEVIRPLSSPLTGDVFKKRNDLK